MRQPETKQLQSGFLQLVGLIPDDGFSSTDAVLQPGEWLKKRLEARCFIGGRSGSFVHFSEGFHGSFVTDNLRSKHQLFQFKSNDFNAPLVPASEVECNELDLLKYFAGTRCWGISVFRYLRYSTEKPTWRTGQPPQANKHRCGPVPDSVTDSTGPSGLLVWL